MKYAYILSGIVTDTVQVEPFSIFSPEYAAQFISAPDDVESGWSFSNNTFISPPQPSRDSIVLSQWGAIKLERERRQKLGIKVGDNWFHSDPDSRTQQLGLVMMGANLPSKLQWKTLTHNGVIFVTMTQTLVNSIFQSTLYSDDAVFTAAEKHRNALESSTTPETYNFTSGWPPSFDDAA